MGRAHRLVLLVVVVALLASCARSPEAKKARHLDRGDSYFTKQRYREAIVEYQNVLRLESDHPVAIRRLGLSYQAIGNPQQAFPYLMKAHQMDASESTVAVKLGTIYAMARRPDEARKLALGVLDREPANLEALELLAGVSRTPADVDGAAQRSHAARAQLDARPTYHVLLADLAARRGDLNGVERELGEAIARDPKSVPARLAMASFRRARGDLDAAERELKTAVEIDPIQGGARLRLAEFYVTTGKAEPARALLGKVGKNDADYLASRRRLAELALGQGKFDESLKTLDEIFKTAPSDVDGHVIRGRVYLAQQKTTEAIQEFHTALRIDPKHVQARYLLAIGHLKTGNVQQAKSEVALAVEQAPFYADAVLLAAELNLDGGNAAGAIESLEKLLAAQPGVVNGYVILGRAYLSSSKRDFGKALQVFRKMETVAPKDPRAPYLIGVVLAAQGDMAEANRHFERSLAMAPGFVDPLIALVGQDMRANRADAALARVQKQIAAAPNASRLHYVLGEVQRTRRDFAAAETAYVRALELEPGLVAPYIELGRLYLTQQKEDQALAKFEQAARVNSADVVSRMMAAQIYMRRQDSVKAKATYEAILAAHPRFAPAANNLAYLYAQEPGKQDEALRLVQIAKEAAPNDPNISDTLGWLLFQRGVYDQAAALLRESAAKLPDNAEVLYHAGMAVHKVGDKVAARTFLAKAVASTAEFPGKSDARKALLELD